MRKKAERKLKKLLALRELYRYNPEFYREWDICDAQVKLLQSLLRKS